MSKEEYIKKLIESTLPNRNEYIFGFADLTGLLIPKYEGYDYGIVIGKKLDDKIIDSIESGPNVEYYNLYNETNRKLSDLIKNISKEIEAIGIGNMPIEPTVHDKDLDEECLKDLRCLPYGTRFDINIPWYCDISGEFFDQKQKGQTCQNNYECITNQCNDNICYSLSEELEKTQGLLKKILNWLERFRFWRDS